MGLGGGPHHLKIQKREDERGRGEGSCPIVAGWFSGRGKGPGFILRCIFCWATQKKWSIGRILSAGKALAPPVFSKGGDCTQRQCVLGPSTLGLQDWLLGTITSWNSTAIPDTIWQSPPLFLPRRWKQASFYLSLSVLQNELCSGSLEKLTHDHLQPCVCT